MSLFRPLIQQVAKIYPTAKRFLHEFHGGVFPQYNKGLSANQPVRDQLIPEKLILPLQQQVGLPADVLVKVGDTVKKNQLLAQSSKDPKLALVVPVHAPTSGEIIAIEATTLPHPSGLQDMAIILKPDGKNEAIDNVLNTGQKTIQSPDELKEILLKAGIIGMGGAGFPTYAKIPSKPGQIHTLLMNGAECEPFITCDDLLMQTQAEEIVQGALITAKALGAKKAICGIETNKPVAIKAMQKAAKDTLVEIAEVETVYPMGGQKQLTLELTGIEMPHKAHAVDMGLLMMNVATYASIYRAATLGEPLTSRMVTVSGLGLNQPFNIQAMIGTPFSELANAAKPKGNLDYPLVMGGPMMGFKVLNNDVPVIKTTNCILANPPEPVEMQMPCIRCGECMDACPVNLLPQQMYFYSQAHEFDKVEKLNVFDCIECGCCSFVCPSHIPLVQYYRHAKSEIKEMHAEEKAVELAKERHEFKMARIEREKQEREARLKAKKEAVKKQAAKKTSDAATTEKKKPGAAAAAAARAAAAKRAAKAKQGDTSSPERNIPPARLKAIEAAKKAAQKSEDSAADAKKTSDPKAAARNAAMQAAKKRAQAKAAEKNESQTLPKEKETAKKDPKQAAKAAAMKAAQKRAKAKQATESGVEQSNSVETPSETGVPEAVDLTENTVETAASKKEAARKAAMQAAKEAAKKRADAAKQAKQNSETPAETAKMDTVEDKRKKAMDAARQRAALRKAQQNPSTDEQESS